MVQDLAFIVLVLLGISILPAMLLYFFLKLVDYGADDQKLTEIQRARREGRPPDFSGDGVQRGLSSDTDADPPIDHSAAGPQSAPSADAADETVTCSECGRENDVSYDVCWNCTSQL